MVWYRFFRQIWMCTKEFLRPNWYLTSLSPWCVCLDWQPRGWMSFCSGIFWADSLNCWDLWTKMTTQVFYRVRSRKNYLRRCGSVSKRGDWHHRERRQLWLEFQRRKSVLQKRHLRENRWALNLFLIFWGCHEQEPQSDVWTSAGKFPWKTDTRSSETVNWLGFLLHRTRDKTNLWLLPLRG